MKNNPVFQHKNSVRRVALFYIFANLCNVWLSRKQLASHIGFWVQPVPIPHVT